MGTFILIDCDILCIFYWIRIFYARLFALSKTTLVPTMRGYHTKAKESVYKLFLAINKMAINREEKVII